MNETRKQPIGAAAQEVDTVLQSAELLRSTTAQQLQNARTQERTGLQAMAAQVAGIRRQQVPLLDMIVNSGLPLSDAVRTEDGRETDPAVLVTYISLVASALVLAAADAVKG